MCDSETQAITSITVRIRELHLHRLWHIVYSTRLIHFNIGMEKIFAKQRVLVHYVENLFEKNDLRNVIR